MLYFAVVLYEAINVYRHSVLLTDEYTIIYRQNKGSHMSKIIQFHDIFKHILIESSFHNLVFFLSCCSDGNTVQNKPVTVEY